MITSGYSLHSIPSPSGSRLSIDTSTTQLTLHRGETDIGMKRLALSDADKQVRDWFVETTKGLGCSVNIDAMGIFPLSNSKH